MSKQLSQSSKQILQFISDNPGKDGTDVKAVMLGSPQTGNNLKLLEEHGYIEYINNGFGVASGWYLTAKGREVFKYGRID